MGGVIWFGDRAQLTKSQELVRRFGDEVKHGAILSSHHQLGGVIDHQLSPYESTPGFNTFPSCGLTKLTTSLSCPSSV